VLDHHELITPLEYLLAFPDAPVEMRGALLSVALESLTDIMQDRKLLKSVKPLEDGVWKALREALFRVVDEQSSSWSDSQKNIVRDRLQNLNGPTNKDKLTQPFTVLGVPLDPAEAEAIARRDKFLHEGRIIDPDVVRDDREAWRQAYLVEMRLFTAISKLLLKYVGYTGPIIDWGARGFDAERATYVMLK
jgi:hypothetical protein